MKTKKSISSRIITGYGVLGIAVAALVIFAISMSVVTKGNLNKISDFSKMNDFIIDAVMTFSNARPNARTMAVTNSYEDSLVDSTVSELDKTLDLLSEFRKEAVRYDLTKLIGYIDNMSTEVGNYKNIIYRIHASNKSQLAAQDTWSAQAVVIVDALANINLQVRSYIDSRISTMNTNEIADLLNSQSIIGNIETQFTSTRIQSTRLMLANDTSKYQPMLDSMDNIIQQLPDIESSLPATIATLVRSLPNEIGKYKDYGTDFYNIVLEQQGLLQDFNAVAAKVQQAISDLNNETTVDVDDVFNASTSQQNITLFVLSAASIGVIAFILVYAIIMIKSISASLKSAADALHSATESISSSSAQLNSAAASLAANGSRQAASIEETSATMNETASMIQQNTENTYRATSITNEAGKVAMEAVRLAGELIEGMNELSKSSDEIQQVISTVSDISFKTNILALNASVESVRAGEAGKSFAVVAGEVRNLSLQSSQATADTSNIITSNMQLTRQNVENSKLVSKTLDEVCEHAKKTAQLLDEISHASEEQTRGVQQINIALSQMEKDTQSNAAMSQESASAANELKNQADNLLQVYDVIDKLVYGSKA